MAKAVPQVVRPEDALVGHNVGPRSSETTRAGQVGEMIVNDPSLAPRQGIPAAEKSTVGPGGMEPRTSTPSSMVQAANNAREELDAMAALLGTGRLQLILCLAKAVGWGKIFEALRSGGSIWDSISIDIPAVVACLQSGGGGGGFSAAPPTETVSGQSPGEF